MAFRAGTGVIDLRVDTKGLRGASSQVTQAMKGIATAGKVAFAAVAAGAVAAGFAVRQAFKETAEYERALARLSAANKTTAQASGFTTTQLVGQAEALAKVTTFSETTILGLQAILSSFVDIRGVNFSDTIETVLDLSTVMGQDARAAAVQLSKALSNPVEQLSALTENGVIFNEEAKKTIKNLVQIGKLSEAQKFILNEVQGQGPKGSARAVGATFTGQAKILANDIGTAFREAGQQMEDSFRPLLDIVRKLIPLVETTLPTVMSYLADEFVDLVNTSADLVGGWENLISVVSEMGIVLSEFKTAVRIVALEVASKFKTGPRPNPNGDGVLRDLKGNAISSEERINRFGLSPAGIKQAQDEDIAKLAQAIADSETRAMKREQERTKRRLNRNNFDKDKVNSPFALGDTSVGSKKSSDVGRFSSISETFKTLQSSVLAKKDPVVKAIEVGNKKLDEVVNAIKGGKTAVPTAGLVLGR